MAGIHVAPHPEHRRAHAEVVRPDFTKAEQASMFPEQHQRSAREIAAYVGGGLGLVGIAIGIYAALFT